MIQKLYSLNISINNKWLTIVMSLLFAASGYSQTDSVKTNYSFILAADKGDLQTVNKLITDGVNINYRDANGSTALFYAANKGYIEIVKTLLYYGANPNIGNNDGFTPLMNAALQGDFDMAQLLLYDTRTKLDIHDGDNSTALHYASYYDNIYIVDMLLYYGANPLEKTKYNTSPLLLASYTGDTTLAGILIDAGNLIKLKNAESYSPMSVAIQNDDSLLFTYYFNKLKAMKTDADDWNGFLKVAVAHENAFATSILVDFFQKGEYELKKINKLLTEAYRLENYSLIKEFNNYGYKASWKPIINSVFVKSSIIFNKDDYNIGLNFGVEEARYQSSISLLFGTRFNKKAIRKQTDENTFYQYWEHRSFTGFQLRKYFYIVNSDKVILKPFISADFQWHFVSYNGLSYKEPVNFVFAPEIGISLKIDMVLIDFSYQYANLQILDVSPHKIKIGVGINIPFYQKTKKYYPLWL